MKKLTYFTVTSLESRVFGELLARILGDVDGRTIIGFENIKIDKRCQYFDNYKADYKIIFANKNNRIYSKYISKRMLKKIIKNYFDEFYKFLDFKEPKLRKLNIPNDNINDSDLPF